MGKTFRRNDSRQRKEEEIVEAVLDGEVQQAANPKTRRKRQDLFFIDKSPLSTSNKRAPSIKPSPKEKGVSVNGKIPCSPDKKIGEASESSTNSNETDSDDDSGSGDDDEEKGSSEEDKVEDEDQIDEEFANLVKEYRALMSIEGENDLEWSLDENAARMLRERKASNPKYAGMSLEEFDQHVCFEEVYGRRHRGSNFLARLQLRKSSGGSHILGEAAASTSSNRAKHDADADAVNFKQFNRDIKEFVRHGDVGEEIELDPYPPPIRKLVHELAHMYGLGSKSQGSGADRHCVLIKCQNTSLPRDLRRLDRFLEKAQKSARYLSSKTGGSKLKGKGASGKTAAGKVSPGSVVGGEAAPIEEENIGNRMLRRLGWSPGQGLGSDKDGRTEPVEAIYKGNRTGLGH